MNIQLVKGMIFYYDTFIHWVPKLPELESKGWIIRESFSRLLQDQAGQDPGQIDCIF